VRDTGPIVAAALVDDHHHAWVELFTGMHLARQPLIVPGTVVAEVGYLLAREAGAEVEAMFLTAMAEGDFRPVDLTAEDYRRAAQLVETPMRIFRWAPPMHGRRSRGTPGVDRGRNAGPPKVITGVGVPPRGAPVAER